MIIYKATNLINGKFYIGQTTKSLEHRMYQHKLSAKEGKYVFARAIKKYGFENFKFEILCKCETIEELNNKEIEFIKRLKSTNRDIGYNMTVGGSGCGSGEDNPSFGKKRSDEFKIKVSKALTGRPVSKETKEKLRIANSGRRVSDEAKVKMSTAHTGRKKSEETRIKMGLARTGEKHPRFGKKISEETRNKMSISKIGKKHTEETKNKIIAAISGKNHYGYDHTIYHFYHPEFGSEFCTRQELQIKFNLQQGNLASVCRGERNQHKGWKIITPQTPEENV